MSNLIDGEKLLAKIKKRRTDTNEVIDYFDVADFELKWIEKYIVQEIKANGGDTSSDKAFHKHFVSKQRELLKFFVSELIKWEVLGLDDISEEMVKNIVKNFNGC